jgi:N utilization substance protein A
MKGMRVQSIIRELRGEKIDIIEFSEEPVDMANRALSPANISRVAIIDPLARHLEVIVEETQLSLAIGKKGQNVRLAAKLMGWRIDIKSEDEKRQEVESAMAAMTGSGTPVSILIEHGLTENLVDKLVEAELSTVEKLADMTPEQLEEIPGIGPKMVEKITLAVGTYFGQFEQAAPAQVLPDIDPGLEEWPADGEPETDEQAAKSAAASVMPGLPVEGADVDEDEDDDIDFDTMDEGSSYSSDEGNEEEAEVIHSDTGSDEEPPQSAPTVEPTPPAEDHVHDNLTAKESEQS